MIKENYLKVSGMNNPIKDTHKSKSPIKVLNPEEAILNARKHTVPIPFIFHSKIMEKRPFESQKNLKSRDLESARETYKTTAQIHSSPLRTGRKSPRLVKSAIRYRSNAETPFKKVKFCIADIQGKVSIDRKKQWKKIFVSLKTSSARSPLAQHREIKPKLKHTIQEINQM
ncbi:hypothetical protein SteCoe_5735 [Stentor coeruleus]|uniref:Uncharacterized protein n=1 Tax=Stentor coeruleus TaxID=5963 RepID=A0A1R2CRS8_9CILI|nr:hypothetical protein SteCoe_5735 [Stentor coeruleus]